MSKNQIEGLETAEVVAETADKKVKKVQTAEEREILVAGVEKIKEIGVSKNLAVVLELVAEWNGEKEVLSLAKDSVIEVFGGSDKLKDYIDGDFQTEVLGFVGLAKAIPVLNNIKAFYARRENVGTGKKVKTVQVAIEGTTYTVNAEYRETIKDMPSDEKKQLLLAHPDTKKAAVIEEI